MVKEKVALQKHYTSCKIEPIELMRLNFNILEFIGYLKGNVIKYILRYDRKDHLKDLKKCWVYLTWMLFTIENPNKELPKNLDEILEEILKN